MTDETVARSIGAGESATQAVVETVAAVRNEQPNKMEPLQRYVDADALDTLIEGDGDVQLQFEYDGCDVAVTGDEVRVEPRNSSDEPDTDTEREE